LAGIAVPTCSADDLDEPGFCREIPLKKFTTDGAKDDARTAERLRKFGKEGKDASVPHRKEILSASPRNFDSIKNSCAGAALIQICRPFRFSPSGQGFVPRLLQTPPRRIKDLYYTSKLSTMLGAPTKSPGQRPGLRRSQPLYDQNL
jgi:hypothetical protein